jgi:hypothetical protein
MNKLHLAVLRWRNKTSLADAPVREAAMLGLLTASVNYHTVYLCSSATGLLAALFSESCMTQSTTSPVGAGKGSISVALCADRVSVILELLICALLKLPLTVWASTAPVMHG